MSNELSWAMRGISPWKRGADCSIGLEGRSRRGSRRSGLLAQDLDVHSLGNAVGEQPIREGVHHSEMIEPIFDAVAERVQEHDTSNGAASLLHLQRDPVVRKGRDPGSQFQEPPLSLISQQLPLDVEIPSERGRSQK